MSTSSTIRNMDIAVIGDQELVSALKLAGVRKTRAIRSDRSAAADIRKALDEYTNDPDVGVIVVLEEFTEMAGTGLAEIRRGKGILPVIVEVPSKRGTRHPDVVAYYKQFCREFLGFDIVI
ncbi:MAG: V-type ATP synthase subunit F [Chloroflexota bacterium]